MKQFVITIGLAACAVGLDRIHQDGLAVLFYFATIISMLVCIANFNIRIR